MVGNPGLASYNYIDADGKMFILAPFHFEGFEYPDAPDFVYTARALYFVAQRVPAPPVLFHLLLPVAFLLVRRSAHRRRTSSDGDANSPSTVANRIGALI
jgi:hypothetical protein